MGKWGKRIGYGIGDLGCNLVFSTMASYLMVFYTDVFGITAAAAGTMMLVTKFIDALTDTGMGLIVDRTHTKWGQGRPYFIIGAIPFAIFTFMTFFIPDFGSKGKLIWAYITYCLLCTAYTVVNIPLNTIVPRLTSDVHERDILVSTRMICAMIGTAIVMSITAPLVKFFGGGNEAKGYLVTMTIYGIVAMVIFFITFASTKEVVPPTVSNKKTSLKDSLKGLTGQAWILFMLNLFYFSLYVVRNTTVLYYFKYNLGRTEWLSLVGILGILSWTSNASCPSCTGKEIQQEKPDVFQCGTVYCRRFADLCRKKFCHMFITWSCYHRTWYLWDFRYHICNAAGCN